MVETTYLLTDFIVSSSDYEETRLKEVAHARLPAYRNVADERVFERTSWLHRIVQVVERSGV